jgi:hypothetical protein
LKNIPIHGDPFEELIKQLTGEAKVELLKEELGDTYTFIKKFIRFKKCRGHKPA